MLTTLSTFLATLPASFRGEVLPAIPEKIRQYETTSSEEKELELRGRVHKSLITLNSGDEDTTFQLHLGGGVSIENYLTSIELERLYKEVSNIVSTINRTKSSTKVLGHVVDITEVAESRTAGF